MNRQNHFKLISYLTVMVMAAGLFMGLGTRTLYGAVESLSELQKIVIMENGRNKPLDTFAQNVLKQFSGQSRFEGKPAIYWLAKVIFKPADSFEDKVFLVTNPEVLDSIEIARQGKARDRYSYAQLSPGLTKLHELASNASKLKDQDRSAIETEIMSLYNKIYIYQELTASFDFFLTHPDFTISQEESRKSLSLPLKKSHYSYYELASKRTTLRNLVRSIHEKPAEELTPSEKELSTVARRIERWEQSYQELPLTIIPPSAAGTVNRENHANLETHEVEGKWLSPWDLMKERKVSTLIPMMKAIVDAYHDGKQAEFDRSVKAFNRSVIEKSGNVVRPKAIDLEVLYNRVDPFYKSEFFYGFSVILMLLTFMINSGGFKKWVYRFSFLLLGLGFILHLSGLVARIIIMQRPPVTNLYETFVFTALITAILGMVLEFAGKRNIGILTGSLAGVVMLLIAGKYAMEGDTMGMLVAVLDSNFWLATHVMTIILGYAGILLSGFIGHVYILQRIFKPRNEELLKSTFQAVYSIQAFGLVFTFLGTTLGGIWADQSWGRFWGWDPKENGALLIVLWSAILFHAKMAKWIKETGFSFGAIVGVIAVALAWFGVNLLGVGLHSYGFTQGVATLLFIFIGIELSFILVSFLLILSKTKNLASVK